jgi:hypothetical protein
VKRVHRLYRQAGLQVQRRRRRARVVVERDPLRLPQRPNEAWSILHPMWGLGAAARPNVQDRVALFGGTSRPSTRYSLLIAQSAILQSHQALLEDCETLVNDL